MGTFRSWRNISSEKKWLRIHDTQEWPDYYSVEAQEDRLKFFDYYLKDEKNGWENTPKVRYVLYDLEGGNKLNIESKEFGYGENIEYKKYYLDCSTRTLNINKPTKEFSAKYDTNGLPGRISFIIKFDEDTSFVGYPKFHVYAEVEGYNDADLFIWVQKLDKFGNILSQIDIPNHSAIIHDFTQDGASILRYKGPNGKLRLSMRNLDEKESTQEIPVYTFDRIEKLEKGQIVEADIILSPIGMIFYKGESIRLVISPKEEVGGSMMPGTPGCIPDNKGWHIIHSGGNKASYLQLPLLKK